MKIKSVTIGAGLTINTGNWENIKINAELTAELDENDILDFIVPELNVQLRQTLEDTYLAQKSKKGTPTA